VEPLEEGDPKQIGPFLLLKRLGAGGMGVVYLGESQGYREVAVKVMHGHLARNPEYRRRFAGEVEAARKVGGFITAQVVDAKPDATPPELPWMATAYIPGPSLAQAIAERGKLSEADVRRLGAALAEGLAGIHVHGYIHRDLKPGNVVLAPDGPRIIDFGIVKIADATSLTAPDTVIGTPEYMSPEQLNGQELTNQCDIFALGGVLTCAATGHSPFNGSSTTAICMQILNGPPNLDPLTGELRKIISDCLKKAPGDRPDAAALLQRFHSLTAASGPIAIGTAGPVSGAHPRGQILQAHEGKSPRAAMQGSSVTSTINLVPPVPPQVKQPGAPQSTARRPAREPQQRRRLVPLTAAGAVAVAGVAGLVVFLLHNHPAGGSPATVSSARGALATTLSPAGHMAWSVAFGPNNTLACGDRNGNTYLWNTATRKNTAILTDSASQGGVFSVAFRPDGILAIGENDGRTDLWYSTTGKHVTLSDISHQVVPSVAFGPDGILATDQVSSTDLWNSTTGKLITRLTDPPGSAGVFSLAFGPAGTLAVGDHNGRVYLWNTTTRKVTATLTDPATTAVNSVAFAPNGTLAVGDSSGKIYLWNTTTRKVTATLTDPATTAVNSVAFAPNGAVLATGDYSGETSLWNITY
jgi:serine/threonine protein kinase